jgi:hypothetical protein
LSINESVTPVIASRKRRKGYFRYPLFSKGVASMSLNVNKLTGKTLTKIDKGNDEILFITSHGEVYKMYHEQDCCESVYIEDVIGDLDDLIGSPLIMAEEVSTEDGGNPLSSYDESYTWTFYKFATVKGYVTIRWYGSSNGYYSESVDFKRVN